MKKSEDKEKSIKEENTISKDNDVKENDDKSIDLEDDNISKESDSSQKNDDDYISKIENLEKSISDYKDKFLRAMAEYDNYRKRSEKEKLMMYSNAISNTVTAFLPVIDSLDLAFKSVKDANDEYKKGFDLVRNQLSDVLKKLGIRRFGNKGEKFNPEIHNAVSHIEDESNKEISFISEVFQIGYMLEDKVIRHAMVQVTN